MKDCIFCQIITKKAPAKIEYEDKETLAFWNINPKAPIHLLIVPKKHIASLKELKENDPLMYKLINAVNKTAKKMRVYDLGYQVLINTGKNAGQIIEHLHLHLMGGWKAEK